jgi:hypothetical protein
VFRLLKVTAILVPCEAVTVLVPVIVAAVLNAPAKFSAIATLVTAAGVLAEALQRLTDVPPVSTGVTSEMETKATFAAAAVSTMPPPAMPLGVMVIEEVAGAALAFTRRPVNVIPVKPVAPVKLKVAVIVLPLCAKVAVEAAADKPVPDATAVTSNKPVVVLVAAVNGTSDERTIVALFGIVPPGAQVKVILGRSSVTPSTDIIGVEAGIAAPQLINGV